MVRETRHLWVGNLPDNIREDRIREHFKRYGRVQSVKLLPRSVKEETGENSTACTVAFMDIKSASKAHTAEHKIDERTLTTEYYEPAAIPSAASPQNTNSTYSTSPGSTRFTANAHGTPDEHGNFNERFYDRNNSRVAEGEYIRRVNYHDNRGRNRDRNYRNGPYNNVIDRHRPLNAAWSYDSTRTYNAETGYGTTPTDTSNDRRSSDSQSTKKKTKSQSGSRSVSPSGSNSSTSPTRSRSQSSSSSSSSTTSQASSSTGSPKSRRIAASANASHQPVVHSDDRRPLAICVRNLPLRSSDTSLKDGLFHEYKKHGKVTWVKIVGQGSERHAIVCFKKPEDVDKALEVSYDKLFFGCKIEVASYQGYDVDDNELRPYEAEIDEFHPKATRTLFIGNLEKDVTASDLRKHFDQFGEIIEIDIKKQGAVSSYAFCQYSDIISVVKAIRAMDGEHLGNNRIKLGFGKSMPTDCVWVDGVVDSVNEKYLTLQFDSFGPITQVIIDRDKGQGLIFYEQVVNAQAAVLKMRGVNMRGRKMQVDFASRECQEAFYEHLEKQGHPADRTTFDERNPATRTFEAAAVPATPRFTRYETPSTRPRTASYSSRSSVGASQCNTTSTVHSPSTPGSATPRGSGSRSRLARFNEFYDPNTEFTERRYRSYDEYSQGSAASHEEGYEHEYATYNRESPSHVEAGESRIPPHNNDHLTIAFAPPDIRNLQKERFHLLEQLEDYTSSGDEVACSKKRLRLDLIEGPVASDVVIEANREHRKVMEVRRTSDTSLKHHSRRPSVDNKHNVRDNNSAYLPHTVCKRRKTAGSDSSSRLQHHEFSGSESIGSSRPGTPLCDERPENFPTEPRRIPREREGPLSLPLPRFAAQLMGKGSVSVAGIKGQKDNVLASPPPAATSPRISNHVAPSLAHVPPPASPPPRPPSLSSNSSDSDATPPSPSLDERIKSLDEKYEKWSGSRAVSAASSEALAKLDATASERFRFSYKLLDLDLKELQPSDIVKSVLAKPSVFDEDSKRLENVGGKFDFGVFPKAPPTPTAVIPSTAPLSAPPVLKAIPTTNSPLPKTPTMLSPRSSGSNIATAKSLQYPFPSHPPLQAVGTPTTPSLSPLPTPPPPPSLTTRNNQLDNRPKPSAPTPSSSDSKLPSKVINRIGTNSAQVKLNDPNKIGVSIPVNCSDAVLSTNLNSVDANTKLKSVRDKNSDKISRRDSTSSNGSPRNEIKNRRNSENSGRKSELCDKKSDNCDTNMNQKRIEEKEKSVDCNERIDSERLEIDRIEKVRLEKESENEERAQKEKQRLEREERERKEREEQEKVEKERKEKEERERREREEKERRERDEKERREREERERREREDRDKHEREEREKREREEKEKWEREEREKRDKEEREKRERDETVKREREEQERVEKERKREENHEKRKEEHNRHRETHGESKHKENFDSNRIDKKDGKSRDTHDLFRNNHDGKLGHEGRDRFNDLKKEEKSKHYDRDDKRKENSKENRENNLHEKLANIANEIKENNKPSIESRHFSIDLERTKTDPNRRKERNNSLPASVGSKRRSSCQDSMDMSSEIKKIKLNQEHRKLSERRESKDSKLDDKTKNKHKNNIVKIIEDKMRQEKVNNVKDTNDERRKDRDRDKDDKHRHKQKLEKQKSKERSKEKESVDSKPSVRDLTMDKEFLARLDLQSTEDSEKLQRQRKEAKEKRKQEILENDDRKGADFKKSDDKKKEKRPSIESKSRDENSQSTKLDERKFPKKERIRKTTHNSSDAATDSDGPKKQPHSIFDIVDDEPAYISMYDKVKARSCKNMQKQEEEKRQEKLKAKFNQLKQSRAKREEKKRSTSCDEDSDSDHERHEGGSNKSDTGGKSRRGTKMLIMSSDEDELGIGDKEGKKRDMYTKSSDMESSDDESPFGVFRRRKYWKYRVDSESSDDEFKKLQKVKNEIFSDNELDSAFTSIEEKCHKRLKEEEKYVKKEKRNKQEFTSEELSTQIFGESPVPEIKAEENFDSERMFGDVSSADDNHEMKKQKNELRKKHKKKQKRQKHSLTSEDDLKIDSTTEPIKDESERSKNVEKKKQHGKKEKRRDKNKEEQKDKSRKSKKIKSENNKVEVKRDGKMENIFGSFSDDSETGSKEQDRNDLGKNSFLSDFTNDKLDNFVSDSDSVVHIEKEIRKSEEKERLKEEHKKRKEKKRREKEKRIREEEFNENSVDYADLGKQLEANIKGDSNDAIEEIVASIKSEVDDRCDDVFRFTEIEETQEIKVEQERKENKEKKKKRKKSKEEKHKHHHHHHDKNKVKSPEIKKELDLLPVVKVEEEVEKIAVHSPSLPNLADLPSSPKSESQEPIINSISKTPTKEKKRDTLIPGFGTEIDEKVHETAIKSISEFEIVKSEITEETKEDELKPVKLESNEDKPRVVISQEETEDAVAALLGESFGENEYASCYDDEPPSVAPNEQETNVPEVNIVEDLEEMRQAVQSLNSGDLDIKPDTPQSEHELQIDTDSDEPEDVNLRFDQSPRTSDTIDLSQPPKTPDIPSYYRPEDRTKTVVIKATNLSSPPSLTPIKPPVLEVKKTTEVVVLKPAVTQPWSEKPVELPKVESMPELKIDTCPPPTMGIMKSVISPTPKPLNTTPHIKSCTIPIVKVSEHIALKPFSQQNKPNIELTTPMQTTASVVQNIKPLVSQSYSLPVHMKFNNTSLSKPSNAVPISKPTMEPPKVSTPNVSFNRLPITPIMMSKPFQATTTALPQPKVAQTNDANRIVENPDKSRATYSSSPYLLTSQSPRMIMENVQLQRGLAPQSVVKHIPAVSYRLPQPTYSNSSLPKESSTEVPKVTADYSKIVPTLFPYSLPSQIHHSVHSVISDIKHPNVSMPDTNKSFMPVIQETPKLSTLLPLPSIIQSTSKPIVAASYTKPVPIADIDSKPVVASYTKPVLIPATEIKQEPPSIITEKHEVTTPKVELSPLPEVTKPELAVIKATEELDVFLKNEKVEPAEEKPKVELEEETKVVKVEFDTTETTSVIKKIVEEDKGESESIESDICKERLSADLITKDDGLDSKEDSDYWSAKEVNIDSVIRKVDALCSADELSDRSSEIGKDEWYDSEMKSTEPLREASETRAKPIEKLDENADNDKDKETESAQEDDHLDDTEVNNRGGRRGGRNRGRKGRGGVIRSGVQTRHAKVKESATIPTKRGGRGGRPRNERKLPKPESDCADVYEFRDDADDTNSNKDRPRLILTIKSPVPNPNNGNPAATTKEVPKEAISPKAENKEEFISPTNTRKSRRLQERDGSKNTVDDTIEDVVRNMPILTRSASAAVQNQQNQLRRSTRQNAAKAPTELTPKTTRGGSRKKDRRSSETTDDSSEEKSVKTDEIVHRPEVESANVPKEIVSDKVVVENPVASKEKPPQGLKAAVLRRLKGDMSQEPQTLIDPVTGLLMPMRECEEGRYIPIGGTGNPNAKLANASNKPQPVQAQIPPVSVEAPSAAPNPPLVLQQQKLQSLKAHVLSSQAARVVVSQQPQKLVTVPPPITQPTLVMKSNIPINQHLNINVSSPNLPPTHLSPKPNSQPSLSKALPVLPGTKMSPPSPNHNFAHVKQPTKSQHIPQIKPIPTNVLKPHFVMQSGPQIINTQVAHAKQLPSNKGQLIKTHGLHPSSQILTGAVASPPLKPAHHNQQSVVGPNPRSMQGSASVPSSGAKGSMEPPKSEVSMPNCVMVPHPTSSPQGQPGRNMLQTGLPLPGYEANMHGDRSIYNRSRSPPPAHQHSPSPQGEALAHFPPGSVKLRTPHDILPAHYLHPQHVMYQQYLRQPYHLPRSPLISNNPEKTVDGQEGEEAPVELRRPGSVGLALTGRPLSVPHSLQSPHDRSTDSPQVAQVYNMHNSRLQHYHPGRYFDQAAEPPPAHRPMPSHGSYGERALGHVASLGTPDRPLSNHLPPDRPLSNHLPPERPLSNHMPPDRPLSNHMPPDRSLSNHIPPERPLSNHMPPDRPLSGHSAVVSAHTSNLGVPERSIPNHLVDRPIPNHAFTLGAGLGAAGNLMGAVARHIGAEAPASQRGLQAATPPHASQVPPQAESLLMLLKQYPCMWQGLLALKNDQAAVQMYFVSGNDQVAKCSLPKNTDGSTPPLRIFQRMRLEPPQVEGVARKMQMENEHCMLLALPCGHDHMDVLKQSTNLTSGFITYLQQKQAAGIVNVAAPGTTQPPAYVVHIFPSCDFVNENLRRIAPNLLERVSDIAHLLIVITTV